MENQLKDLNLNTVISDIPVTFNYNNMLITNEFSNIFDSENNYLKKSLYNSTGFVKAHWGEFENLKVKQLVVENTGDGNNTSSLTNHSDLENRFSWNLENNPNLDSEHIEEYAHDTEMIVTYATTENPIQIGSQEITNPITLREELNSLENLISTLAKNISIKDATDDVVIDVPDEYIESGTNNDSSVVLYSTNDFTSYQLGIDEKFNSLKRRLENIENKLGLLEYRLDTLN